MDCLAEAFFVRGWNIGVDCVIMKIKEQERAGAVHGRTIQLRQLLTLYLQ